MKLNMYILIFLSAFTTIYSSQVEVKTHKIETQVQTKIKMPIVHFKYVEKALENGTTTTKTTDWYTIELDPEIHKSVCTRMWNMFDSPCFNDQFGLAFKEFVAQAFNKDVNSFVMTNNIDALFSEFWGYKQNDKNSHLFSRFYGEVYCLAMYDKH